MNNESRFTQLKLTTTDLSSKLEVMDYFKKLQYVVINFITTMEIIVYIESSNKDLILESIYNNLNISNIQIQNL